MRAPAPILCDERRRYSRLDGGGDITHKSVSRYSRQQHCGVCRYDGQRGEADYLTAVAQMKTGPGAHPQFANVSFVAKEAAHRSGKIKGEPVDPAKPTAWRR